MTVNEFLKKYHWSTITREGMFGNWEFFDFASDFQMVIRQIVKEKLDGELMRFTIGRPSSISGFIARKDRVVHFRYDVPLNRPLDLYRRDFLGIHVRPAKDVRDFNGENEEFTDIWNFAYTAGLLLGVEVPVLLNGARMRLNKKCHLHMDLLPGETEEEAEERLQEFLETAGISCYFVQPIDGDTGEESPITQGGDPLSDAKPFSVTGARALT